MEKYYIYHCSVSEINVTDNEVNPVLEAHTEDTKHIHQQKDNALVELRDIIDKHCKNSLHAEIERLNRVVAVFDQKLANALTVPV